MATMTLECDENNDLYLVDGRNLAWLTGQAATEQNLTQKCLMRLGENQYNTQDGVDYFGTIFTPQPNYDNARSSISSNILEVPDVLMIESLTITIDGNNFEFEADVHTSDYGVVSTSGSASV